MSNCIQVGDEFYPFRWEGERLFAWIKGEWCEVERTKTKNARKEWIFQIVQKRQSAT